MFGAFASRQPNTQRSMQKGFRSSMLLLPETAEAYGEEHSIRIKSTSTNRSMIPVILGSFLMVVRALHFDNILRWPGGTRLTATIPVRNFLKDQFDPGE